MVHRLLNIAKTRQSSVYTPLVGPYRCAGNDDMLDDRQQHPGVTARHKLNAALVLLLVVHSKHPALPSMAATMVL